MSPQWLICLWDVCGAAREMAISREIIKALWTSNCVGWQATEPGKLVFYLGKKPGFIARYKMKLFRNTVNHWTLGCNVRCIQHDWKVVRALLRPRAGLCCSAGWGSVLLGIVVKENTEKTWNRYFWHMVSKPLCGCILGPVWNGLWHFLAVWWSWNHEFAVCIHYQNVWAANCTHRAINNQGKKGDSSSETWSPLLPHAWRHVSFNSNSTGTHPMSSTKSTNLRVLVIQDSMLDTETSPVLKHLAVIYWIIPRPKIGLPY